MAWVAAGVLVSSPVPGSMSACHRCGQKKTKKKEIDNGIFLNHKKKEILPLVTIWMDPEGIMLSEINQRKTNIV